MKNKSNKIMKYVKFGICFSFMLLLYVCLWKSDVLATEYDERYQDIISANAIPFVVEAENHSDITDILRSYTLEARDYATKEHPYLIIIPEGEYIVSSTVNLYSNTSIYAVGATVTRVKIDGTSKSGVLFSTGGMARDEQNFGYKDYQNINIIGGTWIREQGNFSNLVYLIHGTNIKILDAVFDGSIGEKKENNHLIEASAIYNLLIQGCTFKNNVRPKADIDADVYCGGWECVQLDVTAHSAKEHNYRYDGTPSKNIVIKNNIFQDASRGIGTHTAIEGVYIENIQITNNTFENLTDEAVVAYHYYNCKIVDNQILNCGRGIAVQSMGKMSSNKIASYYLKPQDVPPKGTYTVQKRNNLKMVISGNTIQTFSKMKQNCSFGVDLYGTTISTVCKCSAADGTTATIPKGNYELAGIDVYNNTITTNGVGIRVRGAYDCRINNNKLKQMKNDVVASTIPGGIVLYAGKHVATKGTDILNNTIDSFTDCGILIKELSYAGNVKENIIKNISGDAIRISDSATVLGNIEKNTIAKPKALGIIVKGKSIVKGSILSNNVNSAGLDGVRISEKAEVVGNIGQNKIDKAKGCGIVIRDGAIVQANIRTNIITGSKEDSIRISDKASIGGSISSNMITSPTASGIVVQKATIKKDIDSNIIKKTRETSIYITNASTVSGKIKTNEIENSGDIGIYVKESIIKKKIDNNIIEKSRQYGLKVADPKSIIHLGTNKLIKNGRNEYCLLTGAKKTLCKNGAAVKNVKGKKLSGGKCNISWLLQKNCSGYSIMYSTTPEFHSYSVVDVKSKTVNKYTLKGLKKGKNYYIKVVSYTLQGKTKLYSNDSRIIHVK